jgi:hypothetical protein
MKLKTLFILTILIIPSIVCAEITDKCTDGNCNNGYGTIVYDNGTYTG